MKLLLDMNKLSDVCRKSYYFLNDLTPILNGYKTSHILHNKYRRKTGELSSKTFDGNMNCGGLSYLLNYYLNKHDYYTTLTTTSKGFLTSSRSHSYLIHNYFIIDPSYRQMFLPDYSNIDGIKGNDKYHQRLFDIEPFVFIGTYQDLVSKYNDFNKLHIEIYGTELKSNLDMWQDGIDMSRQCDFEKVVSSLSYATKKGAPYMKLHMLLRHKNYL